MALMEEFTYQAVSPTGGPVVKGTVVRYELPHLGAFNFVMTLALGGGVTRSLALDAHGKSLSSALLDLELPDS